MRARRLRLLLLVVLVVMVGYVTFPSGPPTRKGGVPASMQGSHVDFPADTVFFSDSESVAESEARLYEPVSDDDIQSAPKSTVTRARCTVARVVHQTWKDKQVQKAFEPRIDRAPPHHLI
eukprot:SAG31_NODE_1586_length_7821_cov_3.086765_3_plen_120_part_00